MAITTHDTAADRRHAPPARACADTVDALIAPDGTTGCLRTAGDGGVDATLSTLFPK
jgi:hypothetical protein